MNRLGTYNFTKLARIVNKQKVNLRYMRQVFIPINLRDSHWLLMYLDMEASTFFVLDSMSTGLAAAEGYVRVVSQFLQDYFHSTKQESAAAKRRSRYPTAGPDDNLTLWTTKVPQHITKQINGSDCGLHTCINMELLANQNPGAPEDKLCYDMNPISSTAARKKLSIEILTGSLLQ